MKTVRIDIKFTKDAWSRVSEYLSEASIKHIAKRAASAAITDELLDRHRYFKPTKFRKKNT